MKYITTISTLLLVTLAACGRQRSQPRGLYNRTPIKIESDQMVRFSHPSGVALVDFTAFRTNGASYRWRFVDATNLIESAGTGSVVQTSRVIVGIGIVRIRGPEPNITNLCAKAGNLMIPWSYGSSDSAWLYYTKGRTEVQVLSDSTFETENFSKCLHPIVNPLSRIHEE